VKQYFVTAKAPVGCRRRAGARHTEQQRKKPAPPPERGHYYLGFHTKAYLRSKNGRFSPISRLSQCRPPRRPSAPCAEQPVGRCAQRLRPRAHPVAVRLGASISDTTTAKTAQIANWALPQIGLWTARLPVSHMPWIALQPPSRPACPLFVARACRASLGCPAAYLSDNL